MLSIIIADDEAGIIDLCKMLIEYPQARVVGEAHNGLELFDMIGALHPNTVITDLRMPGMTGLELIEKAQDVYPDVNFIVMSGYTDFEYVQTALRFGVWDYLLKPLQRVELNRILKKLDEHLEDARSAAERQETVQCDLAQSMEALRERYLRDIWQGGSVQPPPRIGESPVLRLEGFSMQCLLFRVDGHFAVQERNANSLRQQAGSAIETSIELIRQACREVWVFTDELSQVALLLYEEESASGQEEALLRRISACLRGFNSQNAFVRVSCAASERIPGAAERLPRLFTQAKTALKWRIERRDGNVIRYAPQTEEALARQQPFTQREALQAAVALGDAERVRGLLRLDWQRRQAGIPGVGYALIEAQVRCLNRALRGLPGAEMMGRPLQIELARVLAGGDSPENLPERLADLAQAALREYQAFFASRENSMVVQAKQYVAQHFAEDLSLGEVAKHVCLSPAYFSTLFKSETGGSFVKYLQHVRIEHAKELLRTTRLRVSDVAQAVGYLDLKFFNKIFQNEAGVKPSEYRRFYL